MQKVHTFYNTYEMQKGVVVKTKDSDNEIAVKIKGHFSRGINQDDVYEKREDEEKGRLKETFFAKSV